MDDGQALGIHCEEVFALRSPSLRSLARVGINGMRKAVVCKRSLIPNDAYQEL